MGLKNGLKSQNISQEGSESSVEKDGTIISTQKLRRTLGQKKKSGFCSSNIRNMGINGQKLPRPFKGGLTTALKITGILL
jgi:hypothetical protein